ncbi:MAG: 4-hydroxy-tetrahydrodipicolinate reductase [Ruminococcaceae bacterium]|nr:4-hydroxy-tetrahydrodipicolinate reductase [Oscillospiraceae bacterium]
MIKILLHGCNGKMGQAVTNAVNDRNGFVITCGVDPFGTNSYNYPVYKSFADVNEEVDVIIDFSNPALISSLCDFAENKKIPAVICTTGLIDKQKERVNLLSKAVPVFSSGNMSLGINLLIELCKKASLVFGDAFDVEIIEKHHNLKLDAPSGTALMIADGINDVRDDDPRYVYDRHAYRIKRTKNEIGIHSVRGGTIVGEHSVIFAGNDEVLTITHQAQSKSLFATGAVSASQFIVSCSPGIYDMSDMLK